jgi:hypothetical protein
MRASTSIDDYERVVVEYVRQHAFPLTVTEVIEELWSPDEWSDSSLLKVAALNAVGDGRLKLDNRWCLRSPDLSDEYPRVDDLLRLQYERRRKQDQADALRDKCDALLRDLSLAEWGECCSRNRMLEELSR